MAEEKKPQRGSDKTGAKRLEVLRKRMVRMPEVYLTPEACAEVDALLAAGEAGNKSDLIRRALHEKYLRWQKKKG